MKSAWWTGKVWEVVLLASGKRETSLTLAIGTPSRHGVESVMWDLRSYALANPDDDSFRFTEFAAPTGCDLDDEEAWKIANPALGDFLFIDSFRAALPPKTREATFRRARLGQWVDADDAWMPAEAWGAQATGEGIPDGAPVVLALDGSFSNDHTAITAVTIDPKPHTDKAGHWYNPGDQDWRVDVLEVEEHIRKLCKRWRVKEIAADPYRWQRTLQVLAREGLPVVEFPQSAPRMTPATTGVYEAVINGQLTHSRRQGTDCACSERPGPRGRQGHPAVEGRQGLAAQDRPRGLSRHGSRQVDVSRGQEVDASGDVMVNERCGAESPSR